jgi:ABC-type uncharacterized transport system involved in gliding motility auxiliary subunit
MKLNTVITALAVLIIIAVANLLVSRHPLRLDLTQDQTYTLSPSTKALLKNLDDVLTIRVYFSSSLPPELQAISRDVDDLLSEYKSAADSTFRVEYIDPASSAMEEQKVAMMGIPPLEINVIRRDKQEVAKIYLGMAILYGGKQEIIPVVQGTRNLEYTLDEAIIKVSSSALPKIAWWQPDPAALVEGDGYSIIRNALAGRYEIEDISKEMPWDLSSEQYDALVLISPRKLGADALNAIENYIEGGGKTLALVDRFTLDASMAIVPIETDALSLLGRFGVSVEDAIVLDDLNARATFTGGVVTYHIPYPYWPELRREGLNQELPVSSDLESIVLPWSSPLVLADDVQPAEAAAVVATSSVGATSIPGSQAVIDPKAAADLLARGAHKRFVLIAMVNAAHNANAPGLFVAGSSHWVSDRFISMFPQNAALFQNAVDAFAMGDALIGIRSREDAARPLVPMPDVARFWFKYLNVAAGPLMVGAIGMVIFLVRRRRSRFAMLKYGRAE